MKALPQLLSGLLIASVALLNSSAALSSDARSNEELTKSSAGTTHKQAKKSLRRAKTAQKKTRKYHSQAKPVAQAPAGVELPVVAENAYLPSSTAPVVAKANMPAAATAITTPITVVTPPVVAAASVATAGAQDSDTPKATTATPTAPLVLAKSLTLTSTVAGVPAVAQTAPVVAQKAPSSNPWNTGGAAGAQAQSRKADTIIARSQNPYLAYNAAYNTTYSQPFTAFNPVESLSLLLSGLMFSLPSLPSASQPGLASFNQTPATPNAAAAADLGQMFNSLRDFLPAPHLPSPDIDILPSITKVYPTGERPLYVLTFKCPTELVGITPPPTKALRWLISSGMEAVNSTNLLSFSMQQVCQ
ncbi:MAG: hypothetical protein Q8O33_03985 [Pseudomonadota bacterium]|nr:hypothetical protein [Pseudomonadota bacterium]